jgi:hypothetical protein
MLTRLWLILLLVWLPMPVRSGGSGSSEWPGSVCDAAQSCCQTVARTTCCGEKVVERLCTTTGGRCGSAEPGNARGPRPEIPLTPTQRDLVIGVPVATGGIAPDKFDAVRPPSCDPDDGPSGSLTHNELRALLGVWRT